MALKTYGPMAVDWENRIDFDRLRRERLARAKALLAKSEMGALLFCWWCRAADTLGFRIGRTAPPAEQPVAGRPFAAGNSVAARSDVAGDGSRGERGAQNKGRTREARAAPGAAGDRRRRTSDSFRAAKRRDQDR